MKSDFFFFKVFWRTHMSTFWATGTPVLDFWCRLLWGSNSEWVLPYLFFAEANVMCIPRDPPVVLHLPTSWWPACSRSCPHILLQRWGCRDSNWCSQNICESDALATELNRNWHEDLWLMNNSHQHACAWKFVISPCTLENWVQHPIDAHTQLSGTRTHAGCE